MSQCVFCDIVAKSSPASIVYEDELTVAILDLYPVNRGHTIIIAKRHSETLKDVDQETCARLLTVAQKINVAITTATGCKGVINEIRNGEGADQQVYHLHLHCIPRNHEDGFGWFYPPGFGERPADRKELDRTAEDIKKKLA